MLHHLSGANFAHEKYLVLQHKELSPLQNLQRNQFITKLDKFLKGIKNAFIAFKEILVRTDKLREGFREKSNSVMEIFHKGSDPLFSGVMEPVIHI